MKVFGRDISNASMGFIAAHILYLMRCFFVFRRPLQILYAYLMRTRPRGGVVYLRTGLRIILSRHPHDIITVFLIFCRREYGIVPANGVIYDLGANIGVFSLYAAYCKAKRVHAYEPSKEAYDCLCRNISENRLDDIIMPFRFAVSAVDGQSVKMPISPSPYNRILSDEEDDSSGWVETRTLRNILDAADIFPVDLVKIDCEGAEYDILFQSNEQVFDRVKEIRLEYHEGRAADILSYLEQHGFELINHRRDNVESGNMWFRKRGGNTFSV